MNAAPRSRRPGEHGLVRFRGCCIGLVVLLLLCAGAGVLLFRLAATPAFLSRSPAGTDDGTTTQAIATALATRLTVALAKSPNGQQTIVISERDLSVIAAGGNPDPNTFTDVQVRSLGGLLLVSADSHLGPLPVVVTARLRPSLRGDELALDLVEMDVGDQEIPSFMQSSIDPRGKDILPPALLHNLNLSSFGPDCLEVVSGGADPGVELGFHSPLAKPDPSICAAGVN